MLTEALILHCARLKKKLRIMQIKFKRLSYSIATTLEVLQPKRFMKGILTGIVLFASLTLSAQQVLNVRDKDGYFCPGIIIDGDTIPVIYYDNVGIQGVKTSRSNAESQQWDRLVRNVKKAYPYARLAGEKFMEYNQKMSAVSSEKEKKEMMKKAEEELDAQFGEELKALTFTQGKILLKLIDRQTSNCSYDIVKEFRGKFRAFFYQSFARIFGYNLKEKYDPLGEDADIERIVLMIENGTI